MKMITKLTNLIDMGRGAFLLPLKMCKGLLTTLVVLLSLAAFPTCGSDTGAPADQVAGQERDPVPVEPVEPEPEPEPEPVEPVLPGVTDESLFNYDGDDLLNEDDLCPLFPYEDPLDTDGDDIPDDCDPDTDGDGANDFRINNQGIREVLDPCPLIKNEDPMDTDGDKIPNVCDDDDDDDGVLDGPDDCPLEPNRGTQGDDLDKDGTGDACDDNIDGDAKLNDVDPCPRFEDESLMDTDGDLIPNDCDDDDDGDNVPDKLDNCPLVISTADEIDSDGDGFGNPCDVDDDGDGLIEIQNQAMLRNVRHNLAGDGYAKSTDGAVDRSACGNGRDITSCNGYELTGDIIMSNEVWIPIAASPGTSIQGEDKAFSGTFEGNGYTITGIWVGGAPGGIESFVRGFIADLSGTIRNVHLMRSESTESEANQVFYGIPLSSGITSNYIGSLVGYLRPGGNVLSCSSAIGVGLGNSQANTGGIDAVGGLVGYNAGTIRSSSYSTTMGTVNGNGGEGNNVGGFVGINAPLGVIRNSYASVTVIGSSLNGTGSDYVGGFVGHNNGGTITNSYYARILTGTNYAINALEGADHAGGFVGYDTGGTIENCYAVASRISAGTGPFADHGGGFLGGVANIDNSNFLYNYAFADASVDNVHVDRIERRSRIAILQTLAELLLYSEYNNATSIWEHHNWDFGTESQYPAVRAHVRDVTDQDYDNVLCGQTAPRVECKRDLVE